MTNVKELEYKKAYVELDKMLLKLPKNVYSKIPESVIKNIKANSDKNYSWEFDEKKDFESQNIKVETKALFIQIYRNYLMSESEKEKWEKYDKICRRYIEEEKAKMYDPSKIFNNSKETTVEPPKINQESITNQENDENKKEMLVIEEENVIQRILNMFKETIRKIFKKN